MTLDYKEVAIDNLAAATRGTSCREWTLDGWELLGVHPKGNRGGKPRLVALLRRPRQEQDCR